MGNKNVIAIKCVVTERIECIAMTMTFVPCENRPDHFSLLRSIYYSLVSFFVVVSLFVTRLTCAINMNTIVTICFNM